MSEFGQLGFFIVLAMVLPGVIIVGAAHLLIPSLIAGVLPESEVGVAAVCLAVSVFTCHVPFVLERLLLDRLWSLFPWSSQIGERRELFANRSKIIARAEACGIRHKHLDQILGEFILFMNTSVWLLGMGVYGLFSGSGQPWIAVVVAGGSLATLLYACPFFKKSYYDALAVLEDATRRCPEGGSSG